MSAHNPSTILLRCMVILSFLPRIAIAQEPDSGSAIFQLREAERNFARESVMRGKNTAFIDNLADTSIIFTTSWITHGRKFWKERKPNAMALKWEPEFMDISASGDFGISTGPWEAQEYRPYTERIATGCFLTVWKKQSDGVWKVILDAGSSTPARTSYTHPFSFPAGADQKPPAMKYADPIAVAKTVAKREAALRDAWERDPSPSTYMSYLAPHARMQRDGHLPSTDADSIGAWIAGLPKFLVWTPVGIGAACSDDLAFTYGMLELPNAKKHPLGHYVRIWKKTGGENWGIAIEMMNLE